LDGDGKPDLAVANASSNTVSVYRNTSTSGSIVASSFTTKTDFTTGINPRSVAIGDLDGNGKPDLAVANASSNTVSVFRNTSTSGSIVAGSFATKTDFATGNEPISVAIGDLDGDGKPDLAVANYGSTSVSVFRNADIPATITVLPEKPAICPGASVTLTASGCSGTVTWTGGATPQNGASVSVSPVATTIYTVNCIAGGSTTVKVMVATPSITVTADVQSGKETVKAIQTIVSDKKVGVLNVTPGPNVIYEAGNSITLQPGFVAEKSSVFKAEIKGCN
jgi:hypothetical protein